MILAALSFELGGNVMTKQRLREHSMVSCDCALVSFFFFFDFLFPVFWFLFLGLICSSLGERGGVMAGAYLVGSYVRL